MGIEAQRMEEGPVIDKPEDRKESDWLYGVKVSIEVSDAFDPSSILGKAFFFPKKSNQDFVKRNYLNSLGLTEYWGGAVS